MYDFILKNGIIVDGTGSMPYKANVALFRGRIAFVGSEMISRAKNIIDLKGRFLTPGFIDIHTHTEFEILKDRAASAMIGQGITTSITGNCGIGVFPNRSDSLKSFVSDVLGTYDDWTWSDYSSWKRYVEHDGIGNNQGFLTAHTALRTAVLGDDSCRAATDKEIDAMCELLRESLKAGSLGFSSGLYYAPCIFADRKELLSLLSVVRECGAFFSVHHRCEGNDVIPSLREVLDLAEESGVRLEISHLKAIGRKNQSKVEEMLSMIDEYRKNGVDVYFDQYPYTFGSTSLFSLLPPDILRLSRLEQRLALGLEQERDDIKREMLNPSGWDSIYEMVGPDDIKALFLENHRAYDGLSLSEIGRIRGRDPLDALLDVLSEEPGLAVMSDITESDENLVRIMKHPLMCFSTDSLYSSPIPHPRSYHAAVELLSRYVRDRKVLSIEEAIHKMSGAAASRLKLSDRGLIKEGYAADIVTFSLDELKAGDSCFNEGIGHVFVNGTLAYDGRMLDEGHSGIVL